MKKVILLLVLVAFAITARAPELRPEYRVVILPKEPFMPFGIKDNILISFMWYESRFNPDAEQDITQARGVLQILPVMILEVNRICEIRGNLMRYTWNDAWDVDKSVEIWYIVQNHRNPTYDLAKACRIWFGIGVQYDGKTWREYYEDVSEYIEAL